MSYPQSPQSQPPSGPSRLPAGAAATFAREIAIIAIPAIILAALALWFAFRFVTPPPPTTLRMSTGGATGAYHALGQRYAKILKEAGVTLELYTSAGAVENLKRLNDPASGINVALMQGGIADAKSAARLRSLGRMFHEPIWVFYRNGTPLDRLVDLKGKRIGVGPPGSGTRALAMTLLAGNGITETTAAFEPITGADGGAALQKGAIDALFLALAPEAPVIKALLMSPGVRVMSMAQADAYTKLYPYLSKLTLPQGVVDLVANIPAEPVTLLAPDAALVVREELHPALVELLAEAAQEIHSGPGLFQKVGDFPTSVDPEFEMSPDATRLYKSGPPFLRRYMPFWVANFVQRMLVMLVPLLTIILPLSRILPAIYRWRIRSRMLKWYAVLKKLERRIMKLPPGVQSPQVKAGITSEIEAIDQAVRAMPVPIGFAEQFYTLRGHVDLVRQQLARH